MSEPVLFLDVDGVLCTPLSVRLDWLLRRPMDRQCFDPIALFWLGRLVRTLVLMQNSAGRLHAVPPLEPPQSVSGGGRAI